MRAWYSTNSSGFVNIEIKKKILSAEQVSASEKESNPCSQ
jgi:hypothetical protein